MEKRVFNFLKEMISFLTKIFKPKKVKDKNSVEVKEKEELDIYILDVRDIKKVKELHPKIRENVYRFLIACKKRKLKGGIFCGLRSFEEQAELYAKGRTKPGKKITWAKPGYSYHQYGLSFDYVFKNDMGWTWSSPLWEEIGKLGEKYGIEWGGHWMQYKDRPHFQITLGQSIQSLKQIYDKNKKLKDVWKYLDEITA